MVTSGLPIVRPVFLRSVRLAVFVASLLTALLLAHPPVVQADSVPGGWINTDTTWGLGGSPYIIEGDVSVGPAATLTIDPGVEVRFVKDRSLIVYGGLVVNGAAQPVVFTSNEAAPAKGDWVRIEFVDGSRGRLSNCEIKYGGRVNGPVLTVETGDFQMSDCRIHDNDSVGVWIEKADSSPLLQNLIITDNTGAAVGQIPQTSPQYRNLSASGNHPDGIELGWGWVNSTTTWDGSQANLPFVNRYSVSVGGPGVLTITPGTTVRSAKDAWFTIYGSLTANGNSATPIAFTSNEADPVKGDWVRIEFVDGSHGRLSNCEIKYGGRVNGPVLTVATGDFQISDCRIHDNDSVGVWIEKADSSPLLQNLIITDNTGAAVGQIPQTSPQYRNLSASGNHPDGIELGWGWVNSTTTWDGSQANLPFVNRYGVSVGGPGVLTITPGTTLITSGDIGLTVDGGQLIANGTESKPIVFESSMPSPQRGDWKRIEFTPGSKGELSNCEIGHAGGAYSLPALVIRSSDVAVRNCSIHDGSGGGVSIEGSSLTPVLEDLSFENNGGAAVYQQPSNSPVYRRLTATGNGKNSIATGGWLDYSMAWDGAAAGLPMELEGNTIVRAGQFLALTAGTKVIMDPHVSLSVAGQLYAMGDASHPITFTGAPETVGTWGTIDVQTTGRVFFENCDVGYGGNDGYPMILLRSASSISNCGIHHSGGPGIGVTDDQRPYIAFNTIEHNAMGVRNDTPSTTVDARDNWWGYASGPYHPTLNQAGQGNPVSNGVLFDPWLSGPPTGQGASEDLILAAGGPKRAAPGQTVLYAVFYRNNLPQTINDAILVLTLPVNTEYIDNTGGGIYWPERHQVFWKLGNLAHGDSNTVSVRVRYFWGLPEGMVETALPLMSGSNFRTDAFDRVEYLAYVPVLQTAAVTMTEAQVAAELSGHSQVQTLYGQALTDGYFFGGGVLSTLDDGRSVTELVMMRGDLGTMRVIRREEDTVLAWSGDGDAFTVRDVTGGMRITMSSDEVSGWGAWSQETSALSTGSSTAGPSRLRCMANCSAGVGLKFVFKRYIDVAQVVLDRQGQYKCLFERDAVACGKIALKLMEAHPAIGVGLDLTKCLAECYNDPSKHACTGPMITCDGPTNPIAMLSGQTQYTLRTCTFAGFWGHSEGILCAFGQVCVAGKGCGDGNGAASTEVRIPRDPNAKYGVNGDAVPGQELEYRITYENEGQGEAYGVYVVDRLSEHLDESTLQIEGNGSYIASTRTIIWDIGQLAPKGQQGSAGEVSFTVRLRSNTPAGTTITNQAVVHFPTVPEVTPTNTVVTVVQTLFATPATIHTPAVTPVSITLSGTHVGGGAVTYEVLTSPVGGELSGTIPTLTYTPQANFTGADFFTFRVRSGNDTSGPAEVDIIVEPGATDTLPPQVRWTTPGNLAVDVLAPYQPATSDGTGPLYEPFIKVYFSEPLNASTVTGSTIRLLNAQSQVVPSRVDYYANEKAAWLTPRAPLAEKSTYTGQVTTDVKDASGNSLAQPYSWTFTTAGSVKKVYQPLLLRASR